MNVLDVAEHRLRSYKDESERLMSDHRAAMECWDCESLLASAIQAYKILKIADELLREADYQGAETYTPETQRAVFDMHVAWLTTGELAQERIASLAAQGYVPGNLEEFQRTCDEVRDVVQQLEWANLAVRARQIVQGEDDE